MSRLAFLQRRAAAAMAPVRGEDTDCGNVGGWREDASHTGPSHRCAPRNQGSAIPLCQRACKIKSPTVSAPSSAVTRAVDAAVRAAMAMGSGISSSSSSAAAARSGEGDIVKMGGQRLGGVGAQGKSCKCGLCAAFTPPVHTSEGTSLNIPTASLPQKHSWQTAANRVSASQMQ